MSRLKSAVNGNDLYKSLIKGQIRHEGIPISCEVVVLNRNTKAIINRVVMRMVTL